MSEYFVKKNIIKQKTNSQLLDDTNNYTIQKIKQNVLQEKTFDETKQKNN
jgi:hypothetical protein